jgi:hypothetical protein
MLKGLYKRKASAGAAAAPAAAGKASAATKGTMNTSLGTIYPLISKQATETKVERRVALGDTTNSPTAARQKRKGKAVSLYGDFERYAVASPAQPPVAAALALEPAEPPVFMHYSDPSVGNVRVQILMAGRGLCAEINQNDVSAPGLLVVSVRADGPSHDLLKPGDRIVQIWSTPITAMRRHKCMACLREALSENASVIELTVVRASPPAAAAAAAPASPVKMSPTKKQAATAAAGGASAVTSPGRYRVTASAISPVKKAPSPGRLVQGIPASPPQPKPQPKQQQQQVTLPAAPRLFVHEDSQPAETLAVPKQQDWRLLSPSRAGGPTPMRAHKRLPLELSPDCSPIMPAASTPYMPGAAALSRGRHTARDSRPKSMDANLLAVIQSLQAGIDQAFQPMPACEADESDFAEDDNQGRVAVMQNKSLEELVAMRRRDTADEDRIRERTQNIENITKAINDALELQIAQHEERVARRRATTFSTAPAAAPATTAFSAKQPAAPAATATAVAAPTR